MCHKQRVLLIKKTFMTKSCEVNGSNTSEVAPFLFCLTIILIIIIITIIIINFIHMAPSEQEMLLKVIRKLLH